MPTDDILIRFKADTQQLKAEFEKVKSSLKGVGAEQKKTADQIKSSTQEIKSETAKLTSGNSALGSSFAKLGGLIAAAFSVQQLIAFSQESVKAFQVQEKAIAQLRTALKNVANEGEDSVRRLIGQSAELQRKGIFSDEQINQTQKALVQFGLSAKQTEQLTARIADFAATQGESIDQATDTFLRALEGQQRGLTVAGAKFKDTGTIVGNFNAILQSTEKFAGGSADALETAAGKAENVANRIDDIKERIGENLQPATLLFAEFKLGLTEVAAAFIDFFRQIKDQGKVSDSTITIDDVIKQRIDNIKHEFESLPEVALKEIQKVDAILLEKATGKQKERYSDEIKAIQQIIEERKKQAAFEKDLNKSFASFSDDRIKKEIESLSSSTLANSAAVKDRIKQLEAELVKRKEISEKQIEINRQALEQAAQINAQADADERQRIIGKADADIAQIKATGEAKSALEKAVRAKLNTDLEKFDKDLADKTAKQNLIEIQAAIDIETQKSIDAQQEKFTTIGNFAKDAVEKQQREISRITIEGEILKDKEVLAQTNLTAAERLAAEKKLLEDLAKLRGEDTADFIENEEKKREEIQKTLSEIQEAAGAFNDILSSITESQISSEEEAAQRQTDSLDRQQEHLQKLFDSHKISQEEFDKRSKALADSRVKTEKESQRRINELKRNEAVREKAMAVFTIGLEIAKALAALNFFQAAIAGAQLIAVLAKPLPAFEKGTKKKQGSGLARVGEKGEEIVFLPSGAKVLPAKQTREHADILDSMFDGNLDKFIHKNYVLPALKLQSPNVNINIDYKKLAKANQQRSSVSIDNLHELAEMFGESNPRRVI